MTDRMQTLKSGLLELIDDVRDADDIPNNPQHAYLLGGLDALANYGLITDEEFSDLRKVLEEHYNHMH